MLIRLKLGQAFSKSATAAFNRIENILANIQPTVIGKVNDTQLPFQISQKQLYARKIDLLQQKEFDQIFMNEETLKKESEKIHEIIKKYFKSLEQHEKWEYENWVDPYLYYQTKECFHQLKKNDFTLHLTNTQKEMSSQMVQIHHYHGLSMNRYENLSESCYSIENRYDSYGLNIYKPLQWFENEESNDIDFESLNKQRNYLTLRMQMQVELPFQIELRKKGNIVAKDEDQTHTIIIENELKAPPKFTYAEIEYLTWLKMFRLGEWRLSCIDKDMQYYPLSLSENSEKYIAVKFEEKK